jgi:hypothetical protein
MLVGERLVTPFPPFPTELEKQISRLKLIISRRLEGAKNRVPELGRAAVASAVDRCNQSS